MNILQPIIYLAIGLLIGLFIAKIIAKKLKNSKSQSEDYPEWHDIEEVFDKYIKLGDRIHISFIEYPDGQTRLILRVYDKEACSRSMLYSATYYCVQRSTSRFKVSPGNFIVRTSDEHEIIHLAKFYWADRGMIMAWQ